MNIDRVRDEVGFTVPANRDDIRKLEEKAEDFFSQTGVPLQRWGVVKTELRYQPLDLLGLREGVKLRVSGSLRGVESRPPGS